MQQQELPFYGTLPKELKASWIEALRSGDYDQGKSFLCYTDPKGNAKYCCLGVLTELIHGPDAWEEVTGHSYLIAPGGHAISLGSITDLSGDGQAHLVDLNDKQNYTFDQIADFIQREIPGV